MDLTNQSNGFLQHNFDINYRNVLLYISERRPINEISLLTNASEPAVRGVIKTSRAILEADDRTGHSLLALVDRWEKETGGDAFFNPDNLKQDLLNFLERNLENHELRTLAGSMLRLADSRDQYWSGASTTSIFNWRSEARRIERDAASLAKRAARLLKQSEARKDHIPAELIGEPAWNMLLELFCQFAGGAKISSKSLCIAADCPITTALRYIDRLEEDGFVNRTRSEEDGRVTLVELTEKGVVSVGRLLEKVYY